MTTAVYLLRANLPDRNARTLCGNGNRHSCSKSSHRATLPVLEGGSPLLLGRAGRRQLHTDICCQSSAIKAGSAGQQNNKRSEPRHLLGEGEQERNNRQRSPTNRARRSCASEAHRPGETRLFWKPRPMTPPKEGPCGRLEGPCRLHLARLPFSHSDWVLSSLLADLR